MDKDPPADFYESSALKRLWNRFRDFFGIDRPPDTKEDLEQEIQELLEEGEEQGLISSQEGRMISSIFEFRDTMVYEIMTPRSDLVSVDLSLPIKDIIGIIVDKGFSRIPVYNENQDNIVGILHAKDLLGCTDCQEVQPDLQQLIKPAYFVSENKRIDDLLRDFQTRKIHMAIVTDEFGGVRGLITLEDVLEEIVGEIDDEYDKHRHHWRKLEDGSLLIYAKADVEEVEKLFNVTLPEGPYESVGGLVIHQLGHLPQAGESVRIDGLSFQVVSVSRRHIKTVRIRKL